MSSKGESKSQKAVSTAKIRFFGRKKHIWAVQNKTGAHSKGSSVPLGYILRNVLGISETKKETKIIFNDGEVMVNGVVRKDMNFSVGLFDIVSLKANKKSYRLLLDRKGRIIVVEIEGKVAMEKVSKILRKKVSKKGIIELTTSEGFVIPQGKGNVKVSDSIKISLPDKKIVSHFSFEPGRFALIIGGKHAGKIVKITGIVKGSMDKPTIVKAQSEQGEFNTLEKYVCIVGDEKTANEMSLKGF